MLENVREYSEIVLCDREIETKTFQKLFSEHEQFMLKQQRTQQELDVELVYKRPIRLKHCKLPKA